MITAKTKVCMIIGNPVEHSLSPQMQNAAFSALGLPYIYVACQTDDIKGALKAIQLLNIAAVNITVPHKVNAIKYVDVPDPSVRAIGATNLIIVRQNKLYATNTDVIGAVKAIEENISVAGKNIAVIGAGGAARAIVYALSKKGAVISVWNRTKRKAENLVSEFHLKEAFDLENTKKLILEDIIINTTSIGMKDTMSQSPVPAESIHEGQIIFDIVYAPHETKLLQLAKQKGAKRIAGYKMLLYGGAASFEAITGKKAPIEVMEKELLKYLR